MRTKAPSANEVSLWTWGIPWCRMCHTTISGGTGNCWTLGTYRCGYDDCCYPPRRSDGLLVFSRGLSWGSMSILRHSLEKPSSLWETDVVPSSGGRMCFLHPLSPEKHAAPTQECWLSLPLYPQGVKHNQPHQTHTRSLPCSHLRGYFTPWVSPPHFCAARGRKELSPPSFCGTNASFSLLFCGWWKPAKCSAWNRV